MKKRNITFTTILLVLAFAWLAPLPTAQARGGLKPPPDGGYRNETTAEGQAALFNLTTGFGNSAFGFNALYGNTEGSYNTAIGRNAMFSNTTGEQNTATGGAVLYTNTEGTFNTATGRGALFSNTTGNGNTANGFYSLLNNTGERNTANGAASLFNNTIGNNNIALGFTAGFNLTTGDLNIDIGNEGIADEANTIRIGTKRDQTKTFIAGIKGAAVAGATVQVNGDGQLGVAPSSERFKVEVKPMDKASEVMFAFEPVTFHYKRELDPKGIPQFGLIAEDVAKMNPDLVARDVQGKIYTVRYEAVNAMVLNEFLKQHRKVQQQEETITQIKSTMAKQEAIIAQQQQEITVVTASLKEQASQIENVCAQLQAAKPASKLVVNDQ